MQNSGPEAQDPAWDAEAYHRLSEPQTFSALRLLAQLDLQGTEVVVDAGCGSGRVTAKILERLPHGKVVALDLSPAMLDLARQVLQPTASQAVEFVRADLQEFCMPRVAHGIFSSMAVHFVADPARMYKNLARTLKPGGWLAVQYGAAGSSSRKNGPLIQDLLQVLQRAPYAAHVHGWTPMFHGGAVHSTQQFLRDAGFVGIEVQCLHDDYSPQQRALLREFMETVVMRQPMLQLPEALRPAFLADVHAVTARILEEPFEQLVCRAHLPLDHKS